MLSFRIYLCNKKVSDIENALRLLYRDVRLISFTRYHSTSYTIVCTPCRYGQLSYILPRITVGLRPYLPQMLFSKATQRRVQIPSTSAFHQPAVLCMFSQSYYSLSLYLIYYMQFVALSCLQLRKR